MSTQALGLQIMKMMHALMEVEETYIRNLAIFVSVTLIMLFLLLQTKLFISYLEKVCESL